jgi:hypothetical protein
VAQQGQWKEKEREIMWHSRVGGRKRSGKQIGPAGSVEGKVQSNNLAQQGQMKEKKILSFKVTI